MTDNPMRKHLRAALDVAIEAEHRRVQDLFKSTDAAHEKRTQKLRPLIAALEAIKSEVTDEDGIQISVAPAGASVVLTTSASDQRLTLSTTLDNTMFKVEEYSSFTFSSDGPSERKHRFDDPDAALSFMGLRGSVWVQSGIFR